MKKWQYNLGILFFVGVLCFLIAFSSNRNNTRKIEDTDVEFLGNEPLFVTENFVNKMLKESPETTGILTKESIDLKKVEQRIEKQKHIQNAEVYLSVDGRLEAKVKQRTPIGRVFTGIPFYLDKLGFEMPLSSNYATRVPLVYNYTKEHKDGLLKLLNYVQNDKFLQSLVVGVNCVSNNDFSLKIRNQSFLVQMGGVDFLPLKFKNFKAFYAKVEKDKLFKAYKQVNLEITNQVICTKV